MRLNGYYVIITILKTERDKMKKSVFKKWLSKQDINTKKFWKMCKLKKQKPLVRAFCYKRSELKTISPYSWVVQAFSWDETKQGYAFWERVDINWERAIDKFLDNNKSGKVEFGFGKHKNKGLK